MIIETRGDVVALSGSLHKNQWMSIRAAANLLLHDYPQGIIVDCSGLEDISEDGANTFLEAIRDIESAHARIIVASLPQNVLTVIKTVPGVRSQLPIARIYRGGAGLPANAHRVPTAAPRLGRARAGRSFVVPFMAEVDLSYGADLAARIARVSRGEVRLVYLLEVTRTLPAERALMEQEQAARKPRLTKAAQLSQRNGTHSPQEHVERVRDAVDGALRRHQNL